MQFLRSHLKSIILIFTLALSIYIYQSSHEIVRDYGHYSILYLFLVMLFGPFYRIFPNAPFKIFYRDCLSGLGIGCFYFALLHSYFGFFDSLLGFAGLPYLHAPYMISVITGFVALFILALLGGTSFTWAMKKMGPAWKKLHQFVYLAAILTVIHTLIIGSSFISFTSWKSTVTLIGFLILLGLHAITTHRLLLSKYPNVSRNYITIGVSLILVGLIYSLFELHIYIAGSHNH
jgi:DMSO/TMAO reductase YedYZ heme-binding membrane subunit